jgi:hypothetical protein
MEFSGRLASFPIGDILQWAQNDRRSGALVIRRSGAEKRIFLREGDVVACFSDDPAEFFGQHLLVNGLLDESGLIGALKHCQRTGQKLGDALQTMGLLPTDKVQEALRQHVENQVCDIFLWRSGIFYFAAESLARELELRAPSPRSPSPWRAAGGPTRPFGCGGSSSTTTSSCGAGAGRRRGC